MSHNGRGRRRLGIALRLLLLTVGAAMMVLPFLYMVGTSFKPNAFLFEIPPKLVPDHPTTANYAEAWSSNSFGRYFLNSTYVALSTTFVVLALSATMAYAFARFEFFGKNILFGMLLAGLMIPGIIVIVPQFVLADGLHLLNKLNGLVVAFTTCLLRGVFERVPNDLDEAMTIDGAGALRKFLRLYLPLARPALATAGILSFLGAWDEFVWALTIIDDPAKRTLPIAIAAFQGQHGTAWGLVFAASTIAIVPVIVVYVLGQRQFISGITAGAVKD
jgi:multiple sugar transport system permease protein